ncbi:hypothetical protein SVI_1158 [Shewanella violacea DSS12]|uniref:Transposase DDE domain-containing protein n=1 Tax=Shewanella violacea (strain JCM 10179 / CIP 106290 / LMG 19151 / DSS12) TaxID=637905 RepID=D4ZHI0_SHEVD|nr:hypothetical protein SVI_1158 [Shewanella violacea DSS12]
MLPIEKDEMGDPEIHYTRVYRRFRFWEAHNLFDRIFEGTVLQLHKSVLLDTSIIHGDGTTTERVFAWEDKFKRLLLRFERLSHLHYALKTLAYSMINLRHFC